MGPSDLDIVCLKCLEKEPARRYPSAHAVAEEPERFLRGEPIQARPVAPAERLWRWCKRKPAIASLSAAAALAIVAGMVGITWQWRKTERARRGESLALRQATATVVDLYTHSGLNAAKHGDPTRAALWFAKAAGATLDPMRRAEELTRLAAFRADSHNAVRAFESGIGPVSEIRWSRDQSALALIRRGGSQSAIWELAGEKRWQPSEAMELATWAHETNWVAYISGGKLHVAEFPSGRAIAQTSAGVKVTCLAVSAEDRWIAVGAETPFLWDFASGQIAPLPAALGTLLGLEFSRDGRFLLMTGSKARGICALGNSDGFSSRRWRRAAWRRRDFWAAAKCFLRPRAPACCKSSRAQAGA